MNEANEKKMVTEVTALLTSLVDTIDDDYRVEGQDDDTPTMQVTIASDDGIGWTFQTGDNSFSGGCYNYLHWGVGYLTADSDCAEVAAEMVNEVYEGLAQMPENFAKVI